MSVFSISIRRFGRRGLSVRWLDDSVVELYVRKYPGLIDCTVELNLSINQAFATSGINSVAGTFWAVREWILSLI